MSSSVSCGGKNLMVRRTVCVRFRVTRIVHQMRMSGVQTSIPAQDMRRR